MAKRILCLLLAVLLLAGLMPTAFAAEAPTEPELAEDTEGAEYSATEEPAESGETASPTTGETAFAYGPPGPVLPTVMAVSARSAAVSKQVTVSSAPVIYGSSRLWIKWSGYTVSSHGSGDSYPSYANWFYNIFRLTADGKTAYCIQPGITTDGGTYTETEASENSMWSALSADQQKAVTMALAYGYPNTSGGGTSDGTWYAATQLIIWEFIVGDRSTAAPYTLTGTSWHNCYSGLASACNTIIAKMAAHKDTIPSFAASTASAASTVTLTYDSGSGNYTAAVTDSNWCLGFYSADRNHSAGDTVTLSTGISGVTASFVWGKNVLTITATPEAAAGLSSAKTVTLTNNTNLSVDSVLAYGKSGAQNIARPLEISPVQGYFKLQAETQGTAKIIKTTNTGGSLSGWKFNIYSDPACAKLVSGSPFTTDSNGIITVNILPGTYYVKETASNDPYWAIDSAIKTVTVTAGAAASVTFTNTQYGRFSLKKETNTGKDLSGWKFGVYTDPACKTLVTTLTTGAEGTAVSGNLLPGDYYVKETTTKDGYWSQDASVKRVTVVAGKTVELAGSFVNTQYGRISAVKTTNTGCDLSGWQFGIFSDAGCTKQVSVMTTDASGAAESENLLPGTYYVKETGDTQGRFSSEYWTCDRAVQTVTVTAGTVTPLNKAFENHQSGKVKLIKTTDADGPVEGWQFEVYRQNESLDLVGTYTSSADGTVMISNLEPGPYVIKEIIPEDSLYYCKSENPQAVTVAAGETAEVTFSNAPRPGKISVQKVDINGEPLAGAKFCLEWSKDGTEWEPVHYSSQASIVPGGCSNAALANGCLTTGEDGAITFENLYPGIQYRITEVEAPDGYQLLPGYAFEGELPVEDLLVSLRVVNAPVFTLPQTGSNALALLPVGIILCAVLCIGVVFCPRRKER